MDDFDHLAQRLSLAEVHRSSLQRWWEKHLRHRRADILVVVDTDISTTPGVGFGIRRVIDLIRGTSVGCLGFRVDVARRSSGAPTILAAPDAGGALYTGFRFDMKDKDGATPLLDRYEQVWCFGFKPDNLGGPDTNITQPAALPATDAELAALSKWMDERRGGLFATGDHDYLGASMCHRIPRVRTMRRWTNAQGVPPIGTPARIDTLRHGIEPLDNTQDQADVTPQPIQWVPWSTFRVGYFVRRVRPHPVLCHPSLGPIDVMPDHAHEGLCFDDGEVALSGTFDFDGSGAKPEYPTTPTGVQVVPRVIAYGSTLGSPPTVFAKGSQPFRPRFPMISVYDGHAARVGRVAVDSTWHHWMNVNLDAIANAGGASWDKISRYFVNLACWLNPPGFTKRCWFHELMLASFGYAGAQELSPKLPTLELGRVVRSLWARLFGPCWVTQLVREHLHELDPARFERLFDREILPHGGGKPWPPEPDPCLTCPPLEMIEDAVLGGIAREQIRLASEARELLDAGKGLERLEAARIERAAASGALAGLSELGQQWKESLRHTEVALKTLG